MDIRLRITIAKCWRTLIVKQRIFRRFIVETQRCLPIEDFARRTNRVSTSLFAITIWWRYQGFTISHVWLIHQDRVTEHVLQHFANYSKFGRRFPTRFQLTTARHAVTLAPNLHIVCHCLQENGINGELEISTNSKAKLDAKQWISNRVLTLTIRPTWLLCKLIFDWMSPAFSSESKNNSENSMPKFILWEHPPHFQRFDAFNL